MSRYHEINSVQYYGTTIHLPRRYLETPLFTSQLSLYNRDLPSPDFSFSVVFAIRKHCLVGNLRQFKSSFSSVVFELKTASCAVGVRSNCPKTKSAYISFLRVCHWAVLNLSSKILFKSVRWLKFVCEF